MVRKLQANRGDNVQIIIYNGLPHLCQNSGDEGICDSFITCDCNLVIYIDLCLQFLINNCPMLESLRLFYSQILFGMNILTTFLRVCLYCITVQHHF